jgi:hypothetical protein
MSPPNIWDKITIHNIMKTEQWDRNYKDVLAFAKAHGHLKLPTTDNETRRLGTWLRKQAKRVQVSNAQREKLYFLHCEYNVNEKPREERNLKRWKEMLEKLVAFREANGTFVMSSDDKTNRKLVNWITCQRTRAKLGTLPDERRVMLKDVGFEFECVAKYEKKARFTVQQNKKWDEMYSQLVEFRRTKGHCKVPYYYESNPSLGRWVSTQRIAFKRGISHKERQKRLEELNFVWCMKGNPRP